MPRPKLNLAELKAGGYATATRDVLARAHEALMGFPPEKDEGIEIIRTACIKAAGPAGAAAAVSANLPPVIASVGTVPKGRGKIPNLRPNGKWEGRMRRIRIHKVADTSPNEKAIKLGWEGATWTIKFGETIDAPYPYWEVAKNAVKRMFRMKFTNDEETGALQSQRIDWEEPVFEIVDMGDTPGTENLPTSYMDYFQTEARKTQVFANYKRPMLIQVMNYLHGEMPSWTFDNKDETTIRMMIARTLGPEFDDLINSELYDSVEG